MQALPGNVESAVGKAWPPVLTDLITLHSETKRLRLRFGSLLAKEI